MSKILLIALAAATSLTTASAAIAQTGAAAPAAATTSVTPKVGQLLRDVDGRRLAPIESIQDGSVFLIMDMHMYRIPVSTLSMSDKGLQTKLKRSDLH